MSIFDRAIIWLLRARGYTYPSAIPPEIQQKLHEQRKEDEAMERTLQQVRYHVDRIRKRNDDIDAMAEAMGVIAVPRRRVEDAP
jgi:hypothetical protein